MQYRRTSSQDQSLRPSSSYSSENSYTGEPYANVSSQNAVYEDISQGLRTYSQVPDPNLVKRFRQKHQNSDYVYENAGYSLSDAQMDPGESFSYPGSSFYTDVPNENYFIKILLIYF